MHFLPGVHVPVVQNSLFAQGIAGHAVTRIGNRVHAVTDPDVLPVKALNTVVFPHFRRPAHCAVILQPTVNVVWHIVVDGHMIKLGQWQIADVMPDFAAIAGYSDATIIA